MAGINRVRPYDLTKLQELYPEALTIVDALAALRTDKTHQCPKCKIEGSPLEQPGNGYFPLTFTPEGGGEPITVDVHCDICDGFGVTETEYEAVEEVTGYVEVPELPEEP